MNIRNNSSIDGTFTTTGGATKTNKPRETLPTHLPNGERIIRRRKRKNREQMQLLAVEFDKNPEWSKERLHELSELTGLSEAQIYKWGWDQRKKVENEPASIAPPLIESIQPKKREVKQKEKVATKNENIIVDSSCKIRLDFNKTSGAIEEVAKPLPVSAAPPVPKVQSQETLSQADKRVTRSSAASSNQTPVENTRVLRTRPQPGNNKAR